MLKFAQIYLGKKFPFSVSKNRILFQIFSCKFFRIIGNFVIQVFLSEKEVVKIMNEKTKVHKILLGSALFGFLKSKQSNKTLKHHLGGPNDGTILKHFFLK